jgi:hypothetical protein
MPNTQPHKLAAMATAESVSVRTSDGFAAQGRRLMLLARRKERIEIEGTATERDIRRLVRERAEGGNGIEYLLQNRYIAL